jgi:hypothetical protein
MTVVEALEDQLGGQCSEELFTINVFPNIYIYIYIYIY